jgi:predicted phage gp36 major capsid-like protein
LKEDLIFFGTPDGECPIAARYTTNKSILPKTLLDEMRESFKRSEEFLDLEKAEYDPVEKTKEEVKDNIEKLTRSACKGANACQDPGRLQYLCKQLVTTAEEAERLILEGWQFVATLPNQKVIVRK